MRKLSSSGGWCALSVGLLLMVNEARASSLAAGVPESAESGIPRQNATSVDKPSDDRAAKIPESTEDAQATVSSGRKMNDPYYYGWGALNSSLALPRFSNRSTARKIITIADKKNSSKDANSAYKVMMVHRRFSNRKGHPENHRSGSQPPEEPNRSYATVENVDEQLPIYASEYIVPPTQEYEENYNAIPPEDQSGSAYDNAMSDPWRVNYISQEPSYYGPYAGPPNPYADEPGVLSGSGECSCPSTTRQMDTNCESPGSSFLNLMGALGQNLWALIQLIAVSSVPFLIPLLVVKIILVPLKILKFLKLIKLFVKFFILVPFFVRVVYPALSESFNLQDLLFQKPHQHHNQQHQHEHNILGHHQADSQRDYLNSSSGFEKEAGWDLSGCPSRVACEFAAYLAASTASHFPQNLADFLARKADRARSKETPREAGDDDGENENDQMHRSEPYRAFVVALGKKWTQDMCESEYHCPLPFTSSNSFFF